MLENKTTLEEHDYINSVIYFGALSWCAPCKTLHPWMEEFAKQYPSLRFIYVDADVSEPMVMKHRILSVPTVKLFINGAEKESIMGLKSKSAYTTLFNQYTEPA